MTTLPSAQRALYNGLHLCGPDPGEYLPPRPQPLWVDGHQAGRNSSCAELAAGLARLGDLQGGGRQLSCLQVDLFTQDACVTDVLLGERASDAESETWV